MKKRNLYRLCYGPDGMSGFLGDLRFSGFKEDKYREVRDYVLVMTSQIKEGRPASKSDTATLCALFSALGDYTDKRTVDARLELLNIVEGLYEKNIYVFRGEYAFLSNFYEAPFLYNGRQYRNAEAAFQAQKCANPEEMFQFETMTATQAKKAGKKVALRGDWEDVKVDIMKAVVFEKFSQNEELAKKLLDTNDAELAEGNYWHDTFWGVDFKTGKGKNMLGKILMEVRSEL